MRAGVRNFHNVCEHTQARTDEHHSIVFPYFIQIPKKSNTNCARFKRRQSYDDIVWKIAATAESESEREKEIERNLLANNDVCNYFS